ncbi:MAG: 3-hydroxyacyl-CoA dehydrogenase family protein, partial [Sulfobacillus sp.]
KETISAADAAAALARLTFSAELEAGQQADLAIEAIVEDRLAKRQLLAKLDAMLPQDSILASNTSTLPITDLAAATGRPDRVCGMHFMNPPPMMALIEVVAGLATSEQTVQAVWAECLAYGKTPVRVRDMAGFVSNRVLMPMLNEAMYCVLEGVSDPSGVDTVMKLGMSHPMGPLALADLIGLDTCLAIMEILHRELGDPKFRPCPLLRSYVQAGYLGKKSGRGFYTYAEAAQSQPARS